MGLGKWGRNLLNAFYEICNIGICCTTGRTENLDWLKKNFPKIKFTNRFEDIINDKKIDSIVISTPIDSHFELASKALMAKKHVFIEKPISRNISEAKKLIKIAKKRKLNLFVGYVFLYHPILKKIKELIDTRSIKYIKFRWDKLGTFNESIFLNLVSHDVSIILELLGKPAKIYIKDKVGFVSNSDIITLELLFRNKRKCIIEINRISNFKKKSVTIITAKDLFLWQDDSLYKFNKQKKFYKLIFKSDIKPLNIECKEFIKSLKKKTISYRNASHAAEVVGLLTKFHTN